MGVEGLLLPLVGAFWACATVILSATMEINKIRDRVILGNDSGQSIPLEHRVHTMKYDWLPMALCVIFMCSGFAVLIAYLPAFLPAEARPKAIPAATVIALFSALIGLVWIPGAFADWRAMKAAIERHHKREKGRLKEI